MILNPDNYRSEYTRGQALEEVLRLTEKKLDSQLSVSSAADQRAYAFCAVVFIVLAIAVDFASQDGARPIELVLLLALAASVVLAAFSARPVRFYDSGATTAAFVDYLEDQSVGYITAGLIQRNNENIVDNDARIKRAAWYFRISLVLAGIGIASMIVDVAAQTIAGCKP